MVALAEDAKAAAFRQEHNNRAILAWNIAALSRARRLPNVDTLFVREERQQPHRQTWQEQYALMQQWEAALNRRREMKGA
jgi:hypothetical protein